MSLSRICCLFGVSRQSIYQQLTSTHKREQELERVKQMVLELRLKMPRLGVRKLYYLLSSKFKAQDIKIGRDALFAYLKRENLLVLPMKSYTKTTFSKHWLHKYDNLLKDYEITRPEQVYVSDITYVKSAEKTHYLSLVTDAYSRKIVGYQLSDDMSAEHVVKALNMAIDKRTTKLPLIHHSDRAYSIVLKYIKKFLKTTASLHQ